MSLRRRRRSDLGAVDSSVAPHGFHVRGGYSVTGLLRIVGCVMGPCSLARLAGTLPPHADLVRGACFDLARGSSFSCFGVRPATLANLSFELVLGAVSMLQCSVPPAQAFRVPLLCIQRQQGMSTILACACWWHCAAQLCETVTALCFVDTGLDTAREIPAFAAAMSRVWPATSGNFSLAGAVSCLMPLRPCNRSAIASASATFSLVVGSFLWSFSSRSM